mgnify:CR=1 FL=1
MISLKKCTISSIFLFLKYSSRKRNKYQPVDDVMIWQPLPYLKRFKGFDWLMLIVTSAYVVTPVAHNNGRRRRGAEGGWCHVGFSFFLRKYRVPRQMKYGVPGFPTCFTTWLSQLKSRYEGATFPLIAPTECRDLV